MLTSPAAFLLYVALIYLLSVTLTLRRIHSAQRIIQWNHSLPKTTWKFQAKEEAVNNALIHHYDKCRSAAIWIAACCVLELAVSAYVDLSPYGDAMILFTGCIIPSVACVLVRCLEPGCERSFASIWHLFACCAAYGFQWELGVITAAVIAGKALRMSPADA